VLTVPPDRLDAAARALAGLDVSAAETILIGRVIKRPGLAGGRAWQAGA